MSLRQTNKGGSAAIGSRLLDYGNVTLDFVGSKFYFNPLTETTDLASLILKDAQGKERIVHINK
jgi:hypothetical protein